MCPDCGSRNIALSPSTGALCLACNCNFDPAHARGPVSLSSARLDRRLGVVVTGSTLPQRDPAYAEWGL